MSQITVESPSVHAYITNLQGVINRMAANSTSVKTWCITLVSAMLIFAVDKKVPSMILLTIIPIIMSAILDAYYLFLERRFRFIYSRFIRKLHEGNATNSDLFNMLHENGDTNVLRGFLRALISISIMLFYGVFLITVILVRIWVI